MRTFANTQLLIDLGISPDLITARNLCPYDEANSLQLAEVGDDGREHFLISEAAVAWQRMKKAAESDGQRIFIVSAFRSIPRQVEIIRDKIAAGLDIEDILTVCAPPGFSEHHTGRALDLSTHGVENLSEEFGTSTAFEWLNHNADRFLFSLSYPRDNSHGYQYEPWHWCYAAA